MAARGGIEHPMTVREIGIEIRRLRRQAKRRNAPQTFTSFAKDVAVLLYHKLGHAAAAADFLKARIATQNLPDHTLESLQRMVEDLFLEVPVEKLLVFDDAWRDQSTYTARFAKQWLTKWQLGVWIENQNRALGIAPDSARIMMQKKLLGSPPPERQPLALRPLPHLSRSDAVWAHRFRHSFSVRLLELRAREAMTQEELRGKVR